MKQNKPSAARMAYGFFSINFVVLGTSVLAVKLSRSAAKAAGAEGAKNGGVKNSEARLN
jgi:hypothetical protein